MDLKIDRTCRATPLLNNFWKKKQIITLNCFLLLLHLRENTFFYGTPGYKQCNNIVNEAYSSMVESSKRAF